MPVEARTCGCLQVPEQRETFVADDQATLFDIFTLRFLLLVYLTLLFGLSSGYPNSGLA